METLGSGTLAIVRSSAASNSPTQSDRFSATKSACEKAKGAFPESRVLGLEGWLGGRCVWASMDRISGKGFGRPNRPSDHRSRWCANERVRWCAVTSARHPTENGQHARSANGILLIWHLRRRLRSRSGDVAVAVLAEDADRCRRGGEGSKSMRAGRLASRARACAIGLQSAARAAALCLHQVSASTVGAGLRWRWLATDKATQTRRRRR